ncbi:hypothetical protein HK101_003744, partial [Irineochytrium annulatum]
GGAGQEDGVPLDMTVNVTIVGALGWNRGRDALRVVGGSAGYATGAEAGTDKMVGAGQTGSSSNATVSALAVPALFGVVIRSGFRAPLLLLDSVDACDPFTISLPPVLLNPLADDDVTTAKPSDKRTMVGDARVASAQVHEDYEDDEDDEDLQDNVVPDFNNPWDIPVSGRRFPRRRSRLSDFLHDGTAIPPMLRRSMDPSTSAFTTDTLTNWFALVPRGNCPFDVKVLNAQLAGFAGAIIYNNGSAYLPAPDSSSSSNGGGAPPPDLPVRMSANSLGARVVSTTAMFLTSRDASRIRAYNPVPSPTGPPLALLAHFGPDSWPSDGWGGVGGSGGGGPNGGFLPNLGYTLYGLIADLAFLAVTVFCLGVVFTSACLAVGMARNYVVHGRFFVIV